MRHVNNPNANFIANGVFFPIAAILLYAASELTNSDKKTAMTPLALVALAAFPGAASAALTRFDDSKKTLIEKLQLVATTLMFSAMAMLLNATTVTASTDKPESEFATGAMILFCGHVLMNLFRQAFSDSSAVKGLISDVLGLAGVSLFFAANGIELNHLQHPLISHNGTISNTSLTNSTNGNTQQTAEITAAAIKLFIPALFVLIIGNGLRQNTIVASNASRIAGAAKSAVTSIASTTSSLWQSVKTRCAKKDAATEKTLLLNSQV